MEPNSFGRRLGIGVRVASRMVKERAQGSAAKPKGVYQAAGSGTNREGRAGAASAAARRATRTLVEPGRRVGEGTRRFGQAFFGPLVRTGATLWLEVTGLFFALFALFFAQSAFRMRGAYRAGPEHGHFVLYTALAVLFCYFSFTSFVRSRQRSRKRGAR